jgi:hypothetical protein
VQNTPEEKIFAIECGSGNVEVQWNNNNTPVLGTMI